MSNNNNELTLSAPLSGPVLALGNVPDELKQRAESRAREINAAYERIKSERGFT